MTRTFAIGDPQASFATVMRILDAHGVLGADGRLAPDVHLISIGDHFDYDLDDPEGAGAEGIRVLRWLADHDPAQVTLLLGNHDISRVMELATIDDARFAEARALGRAIGAATRGDRRAADAREAAEFLPRFPELATHGLAARDYASFSTAQRALVIELLLTNRLALATTAALPDGRVALVTHAGVTTRELALLGIPAERDPRAIATALAAHLADAISAVRARWEAGEPAALSLAPIHVAGSAGEEGGGLLYHRPSNPERPGADRSWELRRDRPRRFDPRTLPVGLVQIAGHTGHHKCVEELGDWCTAAARAHPRGGIRTLASDGTRVVYDLGIAAPDPAQAHLVLIDGEMRRVDPTTYRLLALG